MTGPPTPLGVVVPSVIQPLDAHDRVQHLICVEIVLGGQFGTCGLADDKPGDPQGLGHRETLEVVAAVHDLYRPAYTDVVAGIGLCG
jgi:hypothetical protein